MRLLHTSDWHLGRKLFGRSRYDEHEPFLDWLVGAIIENRIDALLIAGDVFDSGTPSHRAQELYYRFLCRVADSNCRHVVVIAGNHDSPSLITAPKEILRHLNVHVVGHAADSLADEVLLLKDEKNEPEAIVCAVPYLRDRDVRSAEAGESVEDKSKKLLAGIRDHYGKVFAAAEEKRAAAGVSMPIVAMGHLFAAGGRTVEGDGVRELYVGSLARVEHGIFPESIDYLALGHLHVPQRVGGSDTRRYSGSPLPISFAEAGQQKVVLVAEVKAGETAVEEIPVPCFQQMETIRGDLETISERIEDFRQSGAPVRLEVIYDGDEVVGNLQSYLDERIDSSRLDILRVRNNRLARRALEQMVHNETLDDLSEAEVFYRCLEAHNVADEQKKDLTDAFREIVAALHESDEQAE